VEAVSYRHRVGGSASSRPRSDAPSGVARQARYASSCCSDSHRSTIVTCAWSATSLQHLDAEGAVEGAGVGEDRVDRRVGVLEDVVAEVQIEERGDGHADSFSR
jgi:hypothetical protein